MKFAISVFMLLFTFSVLGTPSYAQGRGKPQGGPKATSPKATSPKSPSAGPKGPKTEARGNPHADSPKAPKVDSPKAAKVDSPKAPKADKAAKHTPTTTPIDPITPTTPVTHTVKNPKLEARLLALLPAGSTIQDASAGFKNWGQFVAAVHVSNNHNIPFADLKARMTGLTPGAVPGTFVPTTTPLSLGQALQSFKTTTPTTTIATEVKKAEDAANADLRRTRDRS